MHFFVWRNAMNFVPSFHNFECQIFNMVSDFWYFSLALCLLYGSLANTVMFLPANPLSDFLWRGQEQRSVGQKPQGWRRSTAVMYILSFLVARWWLVRRGSSQFTDTHSYFTEGHDVYGHLWLKWLFMHEQLNSFRSQNIHMLYSHIYCFKWI